MQSFEQLKSLKENQKSFSWNFMKMKPHFTFLQFLKCKKKYIFGRESESNLHKRDDT